eukprot:g26577.t1
MAQPIDVDSIRRDFPILHRLLPGGRPLIYFDNAATTQKPDAVIQKEVEVYEQYYANAHRGDYHFGIRVDEELEATRSKVQQFIGADSPDEIVFTSGTTMSINLVANAWGRKFLKPGDEILLTVMEHHANLVPWQQVAAATGAKLRHLPLTDDRQLDLGTLDELLNARTKMVAVVGMSNVLGTLNPINRLVERAHDVGALVMVDAAQSVPHMPVDVTSPPVDFLAFSGHKIYGPTGIGVLYGRRELLEKMDPFLGGGHMIERVGLDRSTWAPPPAKFEAGTLPIAQAIALGAAIDYVNTVGIDAISAHEMSLLREAHAALDEIPGVRIHGPALEHKGAIISLTMEGAHPQDLAFQLDRKGIAVRYGHHCTMPLHEPQETGWIKLNTNENPYPPSPRVVAAIKSAAEGRLNIYPDPLAKRFCTLAAELFDVDPDCILPANGSDENLTILVRTFVDADEQIAYPYPSYVLYETLADIQGARCQRIPLQPDWSWNHDVAAQVLRQTKLIFVPNPNSPSGNRWDDSDILRLIPPDGMLVLDEAYGDFCETPHRGEILEHDARNQIVITRTLSKSYSLAGIRFGFAIADAEVIAQMRKVKDSYNCNTLSLAAAVAALEDQDSMRQNVAKIHATRSRLAEELTRLGFAVVPSQANFVWSVHPTGRHREIYEALKERKILVRFMSFPAVAEETGATGETIDGLRITVGTDDDINQFLVVLEDVLKSIC